MTQQSSSIYQIKVTLDNTHPPIWRCIQVPDSISLAKLHDILQIVMGWQNYHLHMYRIEGYIYGDPADDEYGDMGTKDEQNFKLNQVIFREGQSFNYEYDFGDSWNHTLLVEKKLPPQEGVHYPQCRKGKRACPPEDVGGVWGYKYFLKAIHDPTHEEHERYIEWIGGEFDPEAFNLEEINAQLRHVKRSGSKNSWDEEKNRPEENKIDPFSIWVQNLPDDQKNVTENLALRRDMVALLTYLRENKVTGTQSTGNFPLKAMKEICARFVDPPKLEERVGELVIRVRSEIEVQPIYLRHVLASVGGLITGGLSRRWRLTPPGEKFLAAPAPLQVWALSITWWKRVNWAIAFPFYYDDGYMPAGFKVFTLKRLLEIPTGDLVPFEPFADGMVKEAGLVWPIQDQDFAHKILRHLIEDVVINPLVEYGILQGEHEPNKILGAELLDLTAFRVTHFGKGLLEAIKETLKSEQL